MKYLDTGKEFSKFVQTFLKNARYTLVQKEGFWMGYDSKGEIVSIVKNNDGTACLVKGE